MRLKASRRMSNAKIESELFSEGPGEPQQAAQQGLVASGWPPGTSV